MGKAPWMDLFNAIKKSLGEIDIIAEDLGILTDEVIKLKEDSGFPVYEKFYNLLLMKIQKNPYLPHNYEKYSCLYRNSW